MNTLVPITIESELVFGDKVFSLNKGNGVVISAETGVNVKVLYDLPNIAGLSDRVETTSFKVLQSLSAPVTLYFGHIAHGEEYTVKFEYHGIETPNLYESVGCTDKPMDLQNDAQFTTNPDEGKTAQ